MIATGAWTTQLLAEHGIEANIGIERLQVLATAPRPLDIRPVVYGPLAAKQYALFTDLALVEHRRLPGAVRDRGR